MKDLTILDMGLSRWMKLQEKLGFPPPKCAADVMDIYSALMESRLKSSNGFSNTKETAALGAELLERHVVYMLTIHTGQALSEESYARLVTRHFEKFGITLTSLKILRGIYDFSLLVKLSDVSR